MKTLVACNEILHTILLYSLKNKFGTKQTLWPTCDLQMDFIVLVKDLDLSLKEKNSNILFFTNFGSLIRNLHRKDFFDPGLAQK
jgi:hypothetical protein